MAKYVLRGEGVSVRGLAQLQKALRLMEHEAGPELRKALRDIGLHVKEAAQGRASVRSGSLQRSIKVSVTRTGASVYSTSEYGGVQNVGGRVGRNHATILKRADVSGYMVKAVKAEAPWVEQETQRVIDELLRRFEGI